MKIIVLLLAIAALAVDAPVALRQRALPTIGLVDAHLIVGRARCGGVVWLITDAPALARLAVDERRIVSMPIRGLVQSERPFGLACVRDELWTLTDFRALARLSFDAQVVSRIALRQPRLSLFGAGDSLLLLQPPTASGMPLLGRVSSNDVNRSTPWPGIVSLRDAPLRNAVSSALVTCGLAFNDRLPCWIVSGANIVISDGTPAHTTYLQPHFLTSVATDSAMPIWDVALTSATDGWVLTSAAPGHEGRRVGGRLTRVAAHGDDHGHIDLVPHARMIVSATDRSAVVLTLTGTLMEVTP